MKRPLLLFIFIILQLSCNTTEPPPPEKTITLSLEDASSIESWINLTTSNLQLPTTITLKQNNQTGSTINLENTDSLLYIDSLLPNTTYNFQASTQSSNQSIISNELTITTMDTTSHNFTWQTWTFGDNMSNTLDDVAIIDENNIWVVGEIYLNDSLGQIDPHAYNAVHWDGNIWQPQRITVEFRENMITPPLEGIFAFSGIDIWVVGSLPIQGDGTNWTMYDLRTTVDPNLSLSKGWGSNTNNMYFVGRSGSIAHYNGVGWQKIESGTDVDIQDIWGITNSTSEPLILCAASNVLEPGEHKILSINTNNQIESIGWVSDRRIHSTWFIGNSKLYACGAGVFIRSDGINWVEQTELPLTFTRRIRGTANNDVFVAGDFGFVAHYNGRSWKDYPEVSVALFYSMDYKGNILVAVGERDGKGVVLMMRRE
jgi:hypothetical protein